METPVQIVFHEGAHSAGLEHLIREKVRRLGTIFPRLMRCHVTLERGHRNQQGNACSVRIRLHVPGSELVAGSGCHEDVRAALREAFDAARAQLEEHVQKTRREVKHHGSGRGPGEPL